MARDKIPEYMVPELEDAVEQYRSTLNRWELAVSNLRDQRGSDLQNALKRCDYAEQELRAAESRLASLVSVAWARPAAEAGGGSSQ